MAASEREGSELNLKNLLPKLEPRHKENLCRTCADMGLSASQILDIEFHAKRLREFQKHGKDALQTPSQRIKTLRNIVEAALALEAEVNRLSGVDIVQIWQLMAPERTVYKVSYPLPGRAWYVANEGAKLADAVRLYAQRLEDGAKGGGRKSVLNEYAGYVFDIWLCVPRIQPGRGGDFERLCNAVFEAAEVPAKAEGAIRRFLKNKNVGYYFDPVHMLWGGNIP